MASGRSTHDESPERTALAAADGEVTRLAREVRLLGVYPAHPFRVATQQQAE